MSVVVRMEMPKSCFECPFSIIDDTADGAWCNALAQQVYLDRDEDCPIICSLPEGHGRLVDADANFLGVIHLDGGGFANYNTTIAERLGEEDMRRVKVIVPADTAERSEP